MNKITIKYKKGARKPSYATVEAAGADVYALLDKEILLKPGKRALVPTGLFMEIPPGYEIQVRPRSGLAYKNGVTLVNSPGTIDSDYRGEIKILLINLGEEDFTIKDGMRIAQLVVAPLIQARFEEVLIIDSTERGDKGFGSSGQ
ncbi:dUTP diphosphatase [Spirochaeta cellobiosiphila]|uniref:dUTP diphosphatase n=1 Tax=Spirochaeta cellobiosiphila TaxID=504483 RepID=UPI00049163D5|nr:dUTP diphosphatase [Spirochaeta cellobiosiphila]